jgi:hypothetical protein
MRGLGGVAVIKGIFAGGGKMIAAPNYVRNNRGPVPDPAKVAPPVGGGRFAPRPATSIVWIREK